MPAPTRLTLPRSSRDAPREPERVERPRRLVAVLDRSREDDLGARLDDRVDVHGRVGERAEEPRAASAPSTR